MDTWQCPRCGALNEKPESVIRLARLARSRGDVKVGMGTVVSPRCSQCNFEADVNAMLAGKYDSGEPATPTTQPAEISAPSPQAVSLPPFPPAAALLNLTGLGLGYLYLRRWLRWALHFLLTTLLIVTAYLLNASSAPWLWLPAFGIWLAWMAVDGWRQAARIERETAGQPNPRRFVHLTTALVALALVGGGLWGYYALGQREFSAGEDAYSSGNCSEAISRIQRFSAVYALTFNPSLSAADGIVRECSLLTIAENARQSGLCEDAIKGYETYLEQYPNSELAPKVKENIGGIYFDWAASLRADSDYEAALEKYEALQSDYAATTNGGQAQDAIAQTYWEWAKALGGKNQFEIAEEKYRLLLDMESAGYPESKVRAALADTDWEWAKYLRQKEQFNEAISKYETLLTQEGLSYSTEQIRSELAATHAEWAVSLARKGSYDQAFATCDTLQEDFADLVSESQVADLRSQIHIETGKALAAKQNFTDAMQEFDLAKQTATEESTVQSAQEGYDSALQGLAKDTGEAGQVILEQAGKDACRGKGSDSPIIGVLNEPARFFYGGDKFTLPDDLLATMPGHLRYVICIEADEKVLDRCTYTHGYSLSMVQLSWQVFVNDPLSGKSLFRRLFLGRSPGSCPHYWTFSTTEESIVGKPPTADEIIEWLRGLLD